MSSTSTPTALIVVVIAVGIIYVRQRRRQALRQQHDLKRNQRGVNIAQQWLDPVIEFLVVGGVIWTDLQHGLLPWLFLIVGLAIGIPIGVIRGRFMYIRSISKTKVVIERNVAEVSILIVLLFIKILARRISSSPTSAFNLIAIALLGIGLASSVGRVVYITIRHRQYRQSLTDVDSHKVTKD